MNMKNLRFFVIVAMLMFIVFEAEALTLSIPDFSLGALDGSPYYTDEGSLWMEVIVDFSVDQQHIHDDGFAAFIDGVEVFVKSGGTFERPYFFMAERQPNDSVRWMISDQYQKFPPYSVYVAPAQSVEWHKLSLSNTYSIGRYYFPFT